VKAFATGTLPTELVAGAVADSNGISMGKYPLINTELDDGWPESEKDVFQAALSMVVVKDSR